MLIHVAVTGTRFRMARVVVVVAVLCVLVCSCDASASEPAAHTGTGGMQADERTLGSVAGDRVPPPALPPRVTTEATASATRGTPKARVEAVEAGSVASVRATDDAPQPSLPDGGTTDGGTQLHRDNLSLASPAPAVAPVSGASDTTRSRGSGDSSTGTAVVGESSGVRSGSGAISGSDGGMDSGGIGGGNTDIAEEEEYEDEDAGAGTGSSQREDLEALHVGEDGSGSGSGGDEDDAPAINATEIQQVAAESKEELAKIQKELADAVAATTHALNATSLFDVIGPSDDDDDVVLTDGADAVDGVSGETASSTGGVAVVDTVKTTSSPSTGSGRSSAVGSNAGAADAPIVPSPQPSPVPAGKDAKRANVSVTTTHADTGSTHATFPILGVRNESCRTTCHRGGLRCHAHGLRDINTCEVLEAVAGCEGGCLDGFGLDKPAAVNIRGHPLTLCFTMSNPTRHGARQRVVGNRACGRPIY